MSYERRSVPGPSAFSIADPLHRALLIFGLVAPMITFMIALSPLAIAGKSAVLAVLGVVYLGICIWAYRRSAKPEAEAALLPVQPREEQIEEKLLALEEANEFFGSSLKPADMFRLVASRVEEIVPFAAAALISPDGETGRWRTQHAVGQNSTAIECSEADAAEGLAGLALTLGSVEIDPGLTAESAVRGSAELAGFRSAAALPLFHEGDPFAVFQIFTDREFEDPKESKTLLDAIGQRISPLFAGSLSLERTITNALTDPLTGLPNERALFMVLENQLAESQRYRDERPLSVLAVDVRAFDEVNRRFGHATGDNILRYTAETLRTSLRRMDYLARIFNDEFVIVLPSASEKMAADVVARLNESFAASPFELSEHEEVKIWLNIGHATFWKDGESAQQLLGAARLRKQQQKSSQPGNVLWFGKEYVN